MALLGTEPERAMRRNPLTGYAPPTQAVEMPDPPQATPAPATQPYNPPNGGINPGGMYTNAGSWNPYYQQPGTTQPTGTYGAPPPQPTNYTPPTGGVNPNGRYSGTGTPTAPSQPQPYNYYNSGVNAATNWQEDAIRQSYLKYLGREPSAEEIRSQLSGGGSASTIGQSIQQSPEAYSYYQYRQTPQQQAPGAPPPQPTNYSGAGLEGFDTGKLNDPTHTSVKYTFGRLASKYPANATGYAQLIQDPEFQRMGFQSLGNGNIRLPNGETIDVMRAFGEGGRAWQWGNTDAVAQGQAQALPTDYTGWLQQQYGYQPQQQQQPAFDPYAYAAQLQAYYAQQQAQQQASAPVAETAPTQVWEQPSTPAYDQGTGVQPVSPYDPYAGYNAGTQTLGAPQQAVSALAQGMYPPQMFGDYYGF
jgi:hypothetical protein